jgi:hypothetical protein
VKRGRALLESAAPPKLSAKAEAQSLAMKVETLAHSTEELTWEFLDMTSTGGTLAIRWDKMLASVPFTVAR